MKIINVSGFGNTGCTSQADYLSEFSGVRGILQDQSRNTAVTLAPYQEFGVLKCVHSFGGLIINSTHKLNRNITKESLRLSLLGHSIVGYDEMSHCELVHLKKRELLSCELGEDYIATVDKAVSYFPANYNQMDTLELVSIVRAMFQEWYEGVSNIILKKNPECEIIGLKNDPPGAFPLIASLLPNGVSSAILRNPLDTGWDFLRHYKMEYSKDNIEWFSRHYNSQLNSAKSQILRYRDHIGDSYFVHDFETFVSSDSHRKKYAERMIGKNNNVFRLFFNETNSRKNVNVYKSLDKNQIDMLSALSLPVYEDFKQFVNSQGLFFR